MIEQLLDAVFSKLGANIGINGAWFAYIFWYCRFVRKRLQKMEANVFDCEPAIHAHLLERHFRKLRNEEGVMLMKTACALLQEKKPRQRVKSAP